MQDKRLPEPSVAARRRRDDINFHFTKFQGREIN